MAMVDLRSDVTAEVPIADLPRPIVRYYVLFVLMMVSTVSILDRQILNIMVEPIRMELKLSDSQMGLMTGIAFAVVYATMCIPAARLADRLPRMWIVSGAVMIWSVATACCGLVGSSTQLFLARFGVGFGEAGGSAPSQAFLSDIFPRQQRATVMAVLLIASPLGMALGLGLGGLSLQEYGWRTTFFLAAIPGFILAPLVLFTFPRARKGGADGAKAGLIPAPFLQTLGMLWNTRALPLLMAAAALQTLVASGVTNWLPAFLERSHGLSHAQIGGGLAGALGLGSLIGHTVGGPISDWLGRRDLRWHLWLPAITAPITGILSAMAFYGPVSAFFPLIGFMVLLSGLSSGPMIAITINLSPAHSRATALACLFFVIQGFGLGLGPWVVGRLSDLLKPEFGVESLRNALMLATLTVIPASLCFWLASRHYRKAIADVDALNRGA